MFDEFLLEVFFIKIKIKGYLKNVTENETKNIDVTGIKNKNKISYFWDNIKHILTIEENKITLKRESEEFIHGMIFKENKETITNYYIKELNSSIELKILTNKISITEEKNIIIAQISVNSIRFRK